MAFRLDIPGQVNIHQLRAIELVASLAPRDGVIVEVGSLFGRSSWAWGASAPQATVYCIDPWQGNQGVALMEARLGIKYGVEQFIEHTKDLPNVKPMQGYSPQDFKNWDKPVDIYYEDAVHVNPILKANLDFWSAKVKPTGVICGDDYRPRFPDVRAGAEGLAKALGRELILVDYFWCLLPSEEALPGAGRVAKALRELGAAAAASADPHPRLSVVPFPALPAVEVGSAALATFRIVNDARAVWSAPAGGARLALSAQPSSGGAGATTFSPLPFHRLEFDMPHNVEATLPTQALRAGRHKLAIDIVDGAGASQLPGGARLVELVVTPSAASPIYRLGQEIDFSRDGDAEAFKQDGWVAGERAHSWTSGPKSKLILPLEALPETDLRLAIKLRPLVAPGKLDRQRLTVLVNGEAVFEGALDKQTDLNVVAPKALARSKSPLEIEFLTPDCAQPAKLIEGSADQKYLGMAVIAMSLSAA